MRQAWAAGTAAVVVAATAVWWTVGRDDAQPESCPAPVALEWAQAVAAADLVADVTMEGPADLSDGTTRTTGWLVSVDDIRTGDTPAGGELRVWPTIGDGTPAEGDRLVLALTTHVPAATSGPSWFDSRGLLVVRDGGLARLCRDGPGPAVDASIAG